MRILIPTNKGPQIVEVDASAILESAAHEAGHIVVARYLRAQIFGVGLEVRPEGTVPQAMYGWEQPLPRKQCLVHAAGPAADELFGGNFNELTAASDRRQIEALAAGTLESYLSESKEIIRGQYAEFERTIALFHHAVRKDVVHITQLLPNGRPGVMLLRGGVWTF